MQYQILTRSRKAKNFVDRLMPSIIAQLGLTKCRKFLLIDITNDAGEGNDGMTSVLSGIDSYVVSIKLGRWQDMGVTLAHEMVHVKQLVRGTLRDENGARIWRGRKVSRRVKYLDTPWERQAFARQEIIFRKAIES